MTNGKDRKWLLIILLTVTLLIMLTSYAVAQV